MINVVALVGDVGAGLLAVMASLLAFYVGACGVNHVLGIFTGRGTRPRSVKTGVRVPPLVSGGSRSVSPCRGKF